ncbi:MAG: hypothetical protein HWN80_18930 [Candidatus Lokiarchaeota archaeon]|nr:hypothetical protein [Candidatus Lokiarchaeota archaeon]
MKDKVKVIKSHHSEVLIPFQAEKGEIVSGKERPTQWEGWLYCKNKVGIYGWVPKTYVNPIKDSLEKYQFIRPYNSYEITISKGELVKIKEIESGWAVIENESRKIGWIPLDNLDIDE